jgi:hypothetical protein
MKGLSSQNVFFSFSITEAPENKLDRMSLSTADNFFHFVGQSQNKLEHL